MKKIFLPVFILLLILSAGTVLAQTTTPSVANQCAIINSGNYPRCCAVNQTFNNPSLEKRCEDYQQKVFCQANPNDVRCRAINGPSGGTQPTGPVNGDGAVTLIDLGAGTPVVTSSGAVLCTISFNSLIDVLLWLKCAIAAVFIPLIFSLAFLVFLWGVFKFMASSDVKGKQEGQKVIWWGMLGLFVMVSLWGIIQIVNTTLGFGETTVPALQTEYLKK